MNIKDPNTVRNEKIHKQMCTTKRTNVYNNTKTVH